MARSRRLRRLASGVTLLGAAVSTIVGCTPPDGTTTTTTPASVFPTWIAGDSISRGAALAMDTSVNIVGMAGAAFVSTARSATTISQDIGAAILGSGSMPERVVIVGGVNDRDEVPAVVTDSMTTLEADLESVGVDVVWVTEPAKQFASDVAERLDPDATRQPRLRAGRRLVDVRVRRIAPERGRVRSVRRVHRRRTHRWRQLVSRGAGKGSRARQTGSLRCNCSVGPRWSRVCSIECVRGRGPVS